MTSLQVAARFAAFVWYTNNRKAPHRIAQKEARQFAQEHWQAFLPVANEGMGRLLMRIVKPRKSKQSRRSITNQPCRKQASAPAPFDAALLA